MPRFLAFSSGAYAAKVLGFAAEHLDWSYDFDERINGRKSNKDEVLRFHSMAETVVDDVEKINKPAMDFLQACLTEEKVIEMTRYKTPAVTMIPKVKVGSVGDGETPKSEEGSPNKEAKKIASEINDNVDGQ
eukprot:GHVP01019249.1.p1 GENE.GHVP01019249.1~~GHVP01019249.1.p1  ORF type:complete len:132 (+),score=27.50 GHVP01019249.1:348-743(+)